MLRMSNADGKKLVLIYCCDNSGCSHVRLRYYSDYFNGTDNGIQCVISPIFIFDPNILAACKAIIWQKAVGRQNLSILQRYKGIQQKFGFKLVYEIDDLFFSSPFGNKEGIPDYNQSSVHHNPQTIADIEETLKIILPMFDQVMTSTDYLKHVMMEKFHLSNVVTVKNTVPRFLWNMDRKVHLKDDIKKPVLLYTGSPCHYRNPVPPRQPSPQEPNGFPGIEGNPGDWNLPIADWIIKNVKEDKIDLVMMGSIPYIFDGIKNRIRFVPWTNSYNYPRRCMSIHADFQVAPLVHNEFNKCKSAIKFYESTICGSLLLGSTFVENSDSPYEEIHPDCKIRNDLTVEQIDEKFWALCKKEKYNEILDWQYNNLNKSGMILESDESINAFLKICDTANVNLENI